jgi:hypothetical protein
MSSAIVVAFRYAIEKIAGRVSSSAPKYQQEAYGRTLGMSIGQRCLRWVKLKSPGVRPAGRLYPNSGHGVAPRKLTLCAKRGTLAVCRSFPSDLSLHRTG